MAAPECAVGLYETFIAGCNEEAEEADGRSIRDLNIDQNYDRFLY